MASSWKRKSKSSALMMILMISAVSADSNVTEVTENNSNITSTPPPDLQCLNGTYEADKMWYDDLCNAYQCVKFDGKYSVEVMSCNDPSTPENFVECHQHKSAEKEKYYPHCCPKLRCIVLISGIKYVQVFGQAGENVSNELYKYCDHVDDTHEDHNHTDVMTKYYPESIVLEYSNDESILPMVYTPQSKMEHDTILEWLLWPVEAIFLSESEVFRIIRARHERYYDYNKMWWRGWGHGGYDL